MQSGELLFTSSELIIFFLQSVGYFLQAISYQVLSKNNNKNFLDLDNFQQSTLHEKKMLKGKKKSLKTKSHLVQNIQRHV